MLFEFSDIDPVRRFWPKVAIAGDDECWEWQAAKFTGLPYGAFALTPKQIVIAPRFMFETYCGDIPDGMCVLHSCDNPPCVNPNHLFLGTHIDNMLDRDQKGRGVGGPNQPHWKKTIKQYLLGQKRLTKEQQIAIAADPRDGPTLSKIYGVHRATIDRAKHRHGIPVRYRTPSPKKRRDGNLPI